MANASMLQLTSAVASISRVRVRFGFHPSLALRLPRAHAAGCVSCSLVADHFNIPPGEWWWRRHDEYGNGRG